MYTLDANIFARDADPTEPQHLICRALLEILDQQRIPIVVPNLLLAEVAAAISRTRRDPIRARLAAFAIAAFEHIQFIYSYCLMSSLLRKRLSLPLTAHFEAPMLSMWQLRGVTIVRWFRLIVSSVSELRWWCVR